MPKFFNGNWSLRGFLGDMTFMQNYLWGWGYAFGPGWSVAIEEHFYVGLSLLLWTVFNKGLIPLKVEKTDRNIGELENIILATMFCCLLLRISSNILYPEEMVRNTTMTHLRIDSLLAGVLVAYLYYFRLDYLKSLYEKRKNTLLIIAFCLLSYTPFIEPLPSFFVKTLGFAFLYIAFGILLIHFLLEDKINETLNTLFTKPIVSVVSRIGFCSYSIYVIHPFFNRIHFTNEYLTILVTIVLSVIGGMLMTYYIENYFLKLRDKYYPSRTA